APPGIDYDFWLGPAPLRPFNPRRFHSTWRWFFDYGTGDLGNDGVHRLDYARWALGAALAAQGETLPDLPRAVSALGGKYYFDDAQEWPDTLMVTYDFAPGLTPTWRRSAIHRASCVTSAMPPGEPAARYASIPPRTPSRTILTPTSF